MKLKFLSTFLFVMLIAGLTFAHAQTFINEGHIQGSWFKNQSPYIVKGNITIPAEEILQIEAGVVIQFDGPYKLEVLGLLEAIGLPTDSIIFTVTDTTGFYETRGMQGSWRGISMMRKPGQMDGDTCRLVYCLFEYAVAQDNVEREHSPEDDGGAIYLENITAMRIEKCEFRNNKASGNGGALMIKNGGYGVFINDCIFKNNNAGFGGAIYLSNTHLKSSGNVFFNNEAQYMGGAINTNQCRPVLQFSIFDSNKAPKGGALYLGEGTYTDLAYSILKKNYASQAGGAIFIDFHASVKITGNYLNLNEAGQFGGAIHIDDFAYTTTLLNNSIYKNQAEYGGAVSVRNSDFTANNNTLVYNQASISGGCVYFTTPFMVKMVNNIIYGNWAENGNNILFDTKPSSAQFEYNCFELEETAMAGIILDAEILVYDNNLYGFPGFVNVRSNNYALREDSRCVDAGEPEIYKFETTVQDIKTLPRIFNERIDIGAFEYTIEDLDEEFNF